MYDVIIIGGGAGGLFLCANLKNQKVLLLEKSDRLGKKILITGGGMCNLTNRDDTQTFLTHLADKRQANFIKPALLNFDTKKTFDWFESQGLPLVIREDKKVFPASLKAQSVVDLLATLARHNHVEIHTSEKVTDLAYHETHFTVTSSKETYTSSKVVLATGGMSYPTTGSDGSGYPLAKELGHTIVSPTPALVGITVSNYPYTNFAGNSIRNSQVDFFHAGETKRYLSDKGDLLFTHDGLSGPVILNNSRLIKKGDRIHASLLGTTNKETLYKHLGDLFTQNAKKQLYTLLKGEGLFGNLAQEVLASQFLSTTDTCANLSKERRVNLVKALADQEFIVSSKKGFNAAMVTAGGVALEEIDRKSMESKLVKGLFFTGEVMDIDGDSGGYNLQSAFSTAKLMAQHIQGSKP